MHWQENLEVQSSVRSYIMKSNALSREFLTLLMVLCANLGTLIVVVLNNVFH